MPDRRPSLFYPPRESVPGHLVMVPVAILLQRFWLNVRAVSLPDADRDRLLEAAAQGALICPNHASLHEPVILHRLMQRLGLKPAYLMAWDTLRAMHPIARFLLRGMGVYSIRRGTADRPAFAQTNEFLVAGRPVVVFPEGETSGLNDTLLAFQEGVAQIGFWGLQARVKAGQEARLPVAPVVIKYLYLDSREAVIDETLRRLERQLGLPEATGERYERLRRVGFACLAAIAREYGRPLQEGLGLDEAIATTFDLVLDRVSSSAGVSLEADLTMPQKLRRLFAIVQDQVLALDAPDSPYGRDLQQQRAPAWRALERDLARLQTFQAVRDGYVGAHPSAERYLDVLGRLERDVLGVTRVYGRRRVEIRVGEPLELGEFQAAYQEDRRVTVSAVTEALRERMLALLEPLAKLAPPLEEPHEPVAV